MARCFAFMLAAIAPLACVGKVARVPSDRRPGAAGPVVGSTARLPNGLTLSYVDRGARSSDAIVLLPGLSDSWRSYELVLPHLPPAIRTIAVSQRGHGDSAKPLTGYGVFDFAADLHAFLDAVSVTRAVVVGHSSASLVARRFALEHPERVAGVVLEGSFLVLRGHEAESAGRKLSALRDPISREFVRDFVGTTFGRPVPEEFVEAMIDEALEVPARVWATTFTSVLEYDDSTRLGAFRPPSLIVWGDADVLVDREATDTLARSLQRSELVVYEGVGHTPHWEDPERFARDVSAFAARCLGRDR